MTQQMHQKYVDFQNLRQQKQEQLLQQRQEIQQLQQQRKAEHNILQTTDMDYK